MIGPRLRNALMARNALVAAWMGASPAPSTRRWVFALALPFLAAALAIGPVDAEDCPGVGVGAWDCPGFQTFEPRYAFACTTATGQTSACEYDRPAGYVHIAGLNGAWASLFVKDDFVVGCLAAGTPVRLTLRVDAATHMSASAGSIVGFNLEFYVNGSPTGILLDASHVGLPPTSWSGTRTAELDVTAGTPFLLSVRLAGGGGGVTGDGSATIHATYKFLNLPAGSSLRSCSGYIDGSTATKSVPTSWGRIKSLYR